MLKVEFTEGLLHWTAIVLYFYLINWRLSLFEPLNSSGDMSSDSGVWKPV